MRYPSQLGCGAVYPEGGRALLSVREGDKERVVDLASKLVKLGYQLDATHGTAVILGEAGINPRLVNKVHEGRPHILDRIKNNEYTYIVNTAAGRQAIEDSKVLRRGALAEKVNYTTTLNADGRDRAGARDARRRASCRAGAASGWQY